MTKGDRRLLELAVCLAVMMHLWLFMGTRMAGSNGLAGVPVTPSTSYLGPPSIGGTVNGDTIRTVWSPVLFSLPSELGFSSGILQEKLRARLTFRQPDNTESYLELEPFASDARTLIAPEELMVTAGRVTAPRPPSNLSDSGEDHLPPRRVYVTPRLKERLVGGIVLPPELNRPTGTAWEVRADIEVSEQGFVRHVFLERPLGDASVQQSVVRLLYGLRFRLEKEPVSGRIEIYSPEPSHTPGGDL